MIPGTSAASGSVASTGSLPRSSARSPMPTGIAVRLDSVGVRRGTEWALEGIDLALPRATLTALVGANGAGKSTLLELLAGLRAPTQGRVTWADDLADRIGWLPQRPTLDTSFPMSVLDTVMLGHWGRLGAFGRVRAEHADAARQALHRVGLPHADRRLIGELSAGQLQRLLLARLLLQDRPVLLLDEPFAAIDEATRDDLMPVLVDWAREGRTVVFSTHDLAPVRAEVPHCVILGRRLLAAGPTAAALAEADLSLRPLATMRRPAEVPRAAA
jgi:zinc/manganese transport system ATP-binding protein